MGINEAGRCEARASNDAKTKSDLGLHGADAHFVHIALPIHIRCACTNDNTSVESGWKQAGRPRRWLTVASRRLAGTALRAERRRRTLLATPESAVMRKTRDAAEREVESKQ